MNRLSEIKHRRYEIILEMKELKKELLRLRDEENQLYGYKTIERENQKKKVKRNE